MVSVVSISLSFFPSPCPVQTLIEEKFPLESSSIRVSNKLILSPGTQGSLVSYFFPEGISTMTRSCPYQPTKRLREVAICSSSPFSFSYCGDTAIAGYWVGPDVDDGWGFVKAFVNQIS